MSKVVGDRDASELLKAAKKTQASGTLVEQAQELFLDGVMHGLGEQEEGATHMMARMPEVQPTSTVVKLKTEVETLRREKAEAPNPNPNPNPNPISALEALQHSSKPRPGQVVGNGIADENGVVWMGTGDPWLGGRVTRDFGEYGMNTGTIKRWAPEGEDPTAEPALWHVIYDDGDSEDL